MSVTYVSVHFDPVCHRLHGLITGFIQASMSKIQGLLKATPTIFKDLKLMNITDLSVKILLQKC